MRFRGTFILLLLCAALGAFVYFYEIRGGEQRSKAKEEENRVWKVESGDIQQMELFAGDERVTAVRTGEKQWKITAPRELDADSGELDRLAGSASSINRESVTETNAADLAKFGLEPPQHGLQLKTKDGKEYRIRFGNNNPTGSSTYAALEGSREVFLVTSYTAGGLKKKLDDLRNHSILSFDQYEAQSLDIDGPKDPVRLIKENDRWWLQAKDKWAADSSAVNNLLSALSSGRIKEFFEENADDYQTLGFDKPYLDVRAAVGKDKAIRHLQVGVEKSRLLKKGEKPPKAKPAAESGGADSASVLYIARDESRSELFWVDKEFVDKLLKSPADLRNKALAVFQRWDIDTVVLTNAGGTFTFSKAESGGDWLLGEEKKKVKWDAVNGVLDALERAVKEFVEDGKPPAAYGLDQPAVLVVLKQKGEVKVECAFGKETADGVYAMVKGEPSIRIAEKDVLEKLQKGESDFLEPPPQPEPPKESKK